MVQAQKKESSGEDSVTTVTKKDSQVKVFIPLKDLVQAYIEANDKIKELEAKFEEQTDPLKQAREEIKAEIIKTFKERQEFTTRIEGATCTLSVRKTAIVTDEQLVIKQLEEQGLDMYVTKALSPEFDTAKKQIAEGTKKLMDGIVVKENEFISIRKNDKKEARKVTTQEYVKIGGKHG